MLNIIIDILVGFFIGLIINSNWFQNLINKTISKLLQGNIKRVKSPEEETLESFYKELYKKNKMQTYSIINYIIIYSIIIFIIIGITIRLLNGFIPPAKFGNTIIPNWVFFLIGDVISIFYKQIEYRAKKKIKVTYSNFLK